MIEEALFQALLLMDARQSRYIEKHPLVYRELNPLVRKYGVNKYFITTSLAHLAVTKTISSKYLPTWQYGSIAVEAFWVGRNAKLGVRMSF